MTETLPGLAVERNITGRLRLVVLPFVVFSISSVAPEICFCAVLLEILPFAISLSVGFGSPVVVPFGVSSQAVFGASLGSVSLDDRGSSQVDLPNCLLADLSRFS